MRKKVEGWREEKGGKRDAIKDSKGDQSSEQGGGEQRGPMLATRQRGFLVDLLRGLTLLSMILLLMTMLHKTTSVSTALEKVWVW